MGFWLWFGFCWLLGWCFGFCFCWFSVRVNVGLGGVSCWHAWCLDVVEGVVAVWGSLLTR